MCPSSWKLYVDDFPFFWFLSSSSRTQVRALWSFGVWELMPLAMMMICRTFISQTSNSSSSGSRQGREELKKRKIIYIQCPRWWAHQFMSSCTSLVTGRFKSQVSASVPATSYSLMRHHHQLTSLPIGQRTRSIFPFSLTLPFKSSQ